jgi:hypothetical protein
MLAGRKVKAVVFGEVKEFTFLQFSPVGSYVECILESEFKRIVVVPYRDITFVNSFQEDNPGFSIP